jgi:hypothetical protein
VLLGPPHQQDPSRLQARRTCRYDIVPRIADVDPPGGAGKAIIKLPMPGHYQLRHGREEKSGRCRRATTRGQPGSDNYCTAKEARRLAPPSFRPALLPYFPRGACRADGVVLEKLPS